MNRAGGEDAMLGLMVADKDVNWRRLMADILIEAGYCVTATGSAVGALRAILRKTVQVIVLGREMEEFPAVHLIPLLKRCNRNISIILVSDDIPLPLVKRAREEGIFYHALRPIKAEDWEEIREAVRCAVESVTNRSFSKP